MNQRKTSTNLSDDQINKVVGGILRGLNQLSVLAKLYPNLHMLPSFKHGQVIEFASSGEYCENWYHYKSLLVTVSLINRIYQVKFDPVIAGAIAIASCDVSQESDLTALVCRHAMGKFLLHNYEKIKFSDLYEVAAEAYDQFKTILHGVNGFLKNVEFIRILAEETLMENLLGKHLMERRNSI